MSLAHVGTVTVVRTLMIMSVTSSLTSAKFRVRACPTLPFSDYLEFCVE